MTRPAQAWYSSLLESSYSAAFSEKRAACSSTVFFIPATSDPRLYEGLGAPVAVAGRDLAPRPKPLADPLGVEADGFGGGDELPRRAEAEVRPRVRADDVGGV